MAVRPVPTGSASDRPCLCLRMAAIGRLQRPAGPGDTRLSDPFAAKAA